MNIIINVIIIISGLQYETKDTSARPWHKVTAVSTVDVLLWLLVWQTDNIHDDNIHWLMQRNAAVASATTTTTKTTMTTITRSFIQYKRWQSWIRGADSR